MADFEINREPVPISEQSGYWFLGEAVSISPLAANCDVLTVDSIEKSTFVTGGGQSNLFSDILTGESTRSHVNEERMVDEYRRRAAACNDGTCPFIGQIATCFRREEKQTRTPIDDVLEM